MAVREILLLGNERLYNKSKEVEINELEDIKVLVDDLHDTLMDFRKRYGVGRAIAAPQIGNFRRVIYMHIDGPVVFINPVMEYIGDEKFQVWDDCMSFPSLKVKLLRNKRCRLYYKDLKWKDCYMDITDDLSELLQHEYDHLDGILAVQRALDDKSLKMEF